MNVNIYKSEYTENWHKTVVCDRCKAVYDMWKKVVVVNY